MMKKMVCTGLLAAVLSVSSAAGPALATRPVTVAAAEKKDGLQEEKGAYYYYENGKRVKNEWVTVNGSDYYFQGNGRAATFSTKIKGKYYIFDSRGRLQKPSEKKIIKIKTGDGKSKKYYVNANGTAQKGWSEDKKYYFYETGEMVTGIEVFHEKFYYFGVSGKYNEAKTKQLRKAAKYEASFAGLKKLIGKPVKAKYYSGSCYGKGKDGVLTYENFTVYTFKPDKGEEIFMGADD